ncbi:MAG: beta-lactamase family protein [Selenomonadaceae bacterium]|nr:beta-lactamase family protein [Selenomonadaceae bacterium]
MKKNNKLDQYFANMIGEEWFQVPGLGLVVYKGGEEVYSFFGGSHRISENENLPMTRDSRFRIASVSKMFVAFTLLQLVEKGKLNLEYDVSDYLGFALRNPNFPDTPVTLKSLANHTSSLRDGKIYSIPPEKSLREFFSPNGEYWENGGHFAPKNESIGEYFTYCNLNYGVLGTVIEAVTGERFDIYQKKHILRELDIKGDYVPGNFSDEEFLKLGTAYQKKDAFGNWNENGAWYGKSDDFKGIKPPQETVFLQNPYAENAQGAYSLKNYATGNNATIFSPTGGLRISVGELSHALKMLINDGIYNGQQVLSQKSLNMMFSRTWIYDANKKNGDTLGGSVLSYGLGAYQMDGATKAKMCRNENINLAGHTGEAFGLLSALCFRPGTKDGFVYIMNGTAIDLDDARGRGEFSGNYIWEEKIADAVCHLF